MWGLGVCQSFFLLGLALVRRLPDRNFASVQRNDERAILSSHRDSHGSRNGPQGAGNSGATPRIQPAGGLVEQDGGGRGRERGRDLDEPPLTGGERPGRSR